MQPWGGQERRCPHRGGDPRMDVLLGGGGGTLSLYACPGGGCKGLRKVGQGAPGELLGTPWLCSPPHGSVSPHLWPCPHPWLCPTLGCGLRVPLRVFHASPPTPSLSWGAVVSPQGRGCSPACFGDLCMVLGGFHAWEQSQNCRIVVGRDHKDHPVPTPLRGGEGCGWGCPRVLPRPHGGVPVSLGSWCCSPGVARGGGRAAAPLGEKLHPRGPICAHLRAGGPCRAPRICPNFGVGASLPVTDAPPPLGTALDSLWELGTRFLQGKTGAGCKQLLNFCISVLCGALRGRGAEIQTQQWCGEPEACLGDACVQAARVCRAN